MVCGGCQKQRAARLARQGKTIKVRAIGFPVGGTNFLGPVTNQSYGVIRKDQKFMVWARDLEAVAEGMLEKVD